MRGAGCRYTNSDAPDGRRPHRRNACRDGGGQTVYGEAAGVSHRHSRTPARRACMHRALSLFLFCLCSLQPAVALAAASTIKVTAARVWPAADYTRVTFESASAIEHKLFALDNPERLVLDLEITDITPALTSL